MGGLLLQTQVVDEVSAQAFLLSGTKPLRHIEGRVRELLVESLLLVAVAQVGEACQAVLHVLELDFLGKSGELTHS